jgi:hypothetical protein
LALEYVPAAVHAPASSIPAQLTSPTVVVSLTDGCDAPLEALKLAPVDHEISCHPCDEAIVRFLLSRTHRGTALQISPTVSPGTLALG